MEILDDTSVIYFAIAGHTRPKSATAVIEGAGRRTDDRERLQELAPDLTWWGWSPWGMAKDISKNRRIGQYELIFDDPAGLRIAVFMYSARVFTREQSVCMVRAIVEEFPSAIWSDLRDQPRNLARPRAESGQAERPMVSLRHEIREELRAAQSIAATPAWELAPVHPSREAAPGRRDRSRDRDIPENRVVVAWARMRQRHIQALITELTDVERRLQALDRRYEAHDGDEDFQSGLRDDLEQIREQRQEFVTIRSGVDRVLSALLSHGVGERWTMSPAIRRRPALARLAGAQARPYIDETFSELRDAGLALLPLHATWRLYELWVSLEVARILRVIGFVDAAPLLINGEPRTDNLLDLPNRLEWCFTRGDTRLRWILSPDIKSLDCSDAALEAGLHLTRHQRMWTRCARADLRKTFISDIASNNPDYILLIECRSRVAFAVGDATCSDPKYGGEEDKIIKVGSSYVKHIVYVDPTGALYPCHTPTSFVVIPKLPMNLDKSQKMADERGIVLLSLSPETNGAVHLVAAAAIARIVESLIWTCRHDPGSSR